MTAVLEVSDLLKRFRTPEGSEATVVDIPAFRLEPGEHRALRGGSGSGKTTFLNLIAGILRPDRGRVLVNGVDIGAAPESRRDRVRAASVGYVFQSFNLLQGYSAIENVMLAMLFGQGVDRRRAQQLLDRVGLKDRLHHRPAQLSMGQQQRVAVARALANRPALVLADEPTGNLDETLTREALALIRETCREEQSALLLVSHDPSVLASFERVDDFTAVNRAAASSAALT